MEMEGGVCRCKVCNCVSALLGFVDFDKNSGIFNKDKKRQIQL